MILNPLFLPKQNESSEGTANNFSLDKSNYLFSDIIKLLDPEEANSENLTDSDLNIIQSEDLKCKTDEDNIEEAMLNLIIPSLTLNCENEVLKKSEIFNLNSELASGMKNDLAQSLQSKLKLTELNLQKPNNLTELFPEGQIETYKIIKDIEKINSSSINKEKFLNDVDAVFKNDAIISETNKKISEAFGKKNNSNQSSSNTSLTELEKLSLEKVNVKNIFFLPTKKDELLSKQDLTLRENVTANFSEEKKILSEKLESNLTKLPQKKFESDEKIFNQLNVKDILLNKQGKSVDYKTEYTSKVNLVDGEVDNNLEVVENPVKENKEKIFTNNLIKEKVDDELTNSLQTSNESGFENHKNNFQKEFNNLISSVKNFALSNKSGDESSLKVIKYSELNNFLTELLSKKENDVVTVNLEPQTLGKLKVTMQVVENSATISMEVENRVTQNLIESNLEMLQKNLNQNGIHLSSLQINSKTSEQKNSRQWTFNKKRNDFKIDETDEKDESIKNFGYNTYEYLI